MQGQLAYESNKLYHKYRVNFLRRRAIHVLANGDNYRHAALAMCLAIAMYIATGVLGIIQQALSVIGVFLLTLLGRTILLVGHILTGGDTSRERRVVREERESLTDSESNRATKSERYLKSRHSSKTIKPANVQTISSTQTSTQILTQTSTETSIS